MLDTARQITWKPAFGLDREVDWLTNMHDWLISKPNRYWGLALPIYECKKCGWFTVIGSREELKDKAVSGWKSFDGHSPHKPYIDDVKITCDRCGETVSRLPDVGNVWLDAGIVGFSTLIDPKTGKLSYTTDKTYWREWYPADFITESFPGQFKNWFYSMIAMSTVLEKSTCFKTVLGYGSMLGEDGRPMHKSWGNSIEFNEGADKIGADVMRWMFAKHNPEQNLLFGYRLADETRRKFHLLLWNVYNFFITYAVIDGWTPEEKVSSIKYQVSRNVLDRWIMSKLNGLVQTVTESLDHYDASTAAIAIEVFVTDVSQWYVRRSRDRVGPSATDQQDKNACYQTLYHVLVTLMTLLAPFTPYMAEEIYRNLTGNTSVHLSDWPASDKKIIDEGLERAMTLAREIVEKAHAERKAKMIKVRIPLLSATYTAPHTLARDIERVVSDEINVKQVKYNKSPAEDGISVVLDVTVTPELQTEGQVRELIREIQVLRKEKGCKIDERVALTLPQAFKNLPAKFIETIQRETLATDIAWSTNLSISTTKATIT